MGACFIQHLKTADSYNQMGGDSLNFLLFFNVLYIWTIMDLDSFHVQETQRLVGTWEYDYRKSAPAKMFYVPSSCIRAGKAFLLFFSLFPSFNINAQ